MTHLISIEEYQNIIKESHLIIIFEEHCDLSNYFFNNINDINFNKIFLVDRKKYNILFNKLFFLLTPSIILNKKNIFPADIKSLNDIITHTQ